MAAGLGFKTFTTGEVLTAADVNGYLMQGILVFATEAARNSAITSPQEGQFAFTKDTNSLWYYTGSAWVASGATGDIEGVTAGIGISGGGTSGTVTITNSMATAIDAKGDLVAGTGADTFSRLAVGANDTVLTADSSTATGLKWATPSGAAKTYTLVNAGGTSLTGNSVSITGLSTYDDLLIIIRGASSSSSSQSFYGSVNSVVTANSYTRAGSVTTFGSTYSNAIPSNANSSDTEIRLGTMSNDASSTVSGGVRISGCRGTGVKPLSVVFGGDLASGTADAGSIAYQGVINATTAISSFQIFLAGAATMDAGTIFVYGAI